jgi:hypothetical protein
MYEVANDVIEQVSGVQNDESYFMSQGVLKPSVLVRRRIRTVLGFLESFKYSFAARQTASHSIELLYIRVPT